MGNAFCRTPGPVVQLLTQKNYLIAILVLFLSFHLLKATKQALQPFPGSCRITLQSLDVATLQNFLTERCVHFLPPHFLNFGGGLLVWVIFFLNFFLDSLHPPLRNVSDVETLSTNHKSRTSFPSCQEARVKMQLWQGGWGCLCILLLWEPALVRNLHKQPSGALAAGAHLQPNAFSKKLCG